MRVLREQLLIPLGFAIAVIGGGALWLGNTYGIVSGNADSIELLRLKQETYNQHLIDIKAELGEIRGELKRIQK